MLKQLWCRIVGTGCKWKTIKETPFKITKEIHWTLQTSTGTQYTIQCETCGKICFERDIE